MLKRRVILLLMATATALVLASGVALAITKQCATVDLDSGDPRGTCFGTPGADLLKGTPGNNIIYGRGGGDTLKGFDSEDWLHGDDGDDELLGGDRLDNLWGGAGKDALKGGEDFDTYFYKTNDWGHDTITDSPGNGIWFDRLLGPTITTDLHIDLRSGAGPEVKNEAGTSTINWSGAVINAVRNQGTGNDVIRGNAAPNFIYSTVDTSRSRPGGADFIATGGGNDTISVEDGFGGDTVKCGENAGTATDDDTVYFDPGDTVINCERKNPPR